MRVLYLTHNYPRFAADPSGAFIEELIGALAKDEVEPYVLCPHAAGLAEREKSHGVKICRFRYAPDKDETLAYEGRMLAALKHVKSLRLLASFLKAFARETRRIVDEEKIDLVHAHWLLPAGVAARVALATSRVTLLLSVHGTDVRVLKGLPFGSLLARWVLKRVRLILPVSSYLRDRVSGLVGMGIPSIVLPMPASDMFLTSARKKLTRRIIGIGNLARQKRFDVLVRSLGILARGKIDLDLTLVGDGPERARLEGLAKEEGMARKVKFLGRKPHHELPVILREAGVMVLPSVEEGFGVVLVEAQLAGLAVIGADSGGQREIIQPGETGILVPPDDPHALAQAIKELYNNERKTLLMAKRGQQAAKERFLAAPAALRLLNIYKRILG